MSKQKSSQYLQLRIGTKLEIDTKSKKRKKEEFKIDPESLLYHTAIIGQSGSGKSFMVGRLIEEICLQTNGKLVIFDINSDFSNLDIPYEDAWKRISGYSPWFIENYKNDQNYKSFSVVWKEIIKTDLFKFNTIGKDNKSIEIPWKKLSEYELRQLLRIHPREQPECTWLLSRLFQEADKYDWELKDWEEIPKLLVKWARQNIDMKYDGYKFRESFARYISITTSVEAAQRISAAISDALDYKIWEGKESKKEFSSIFPSDNFESDLPTIKLPRIVTINLDSLQNHQARLFVVRHTLENLWKMATESRWNIMFEGVKDTRYPIFIIVDEAHRFIPDETDLFAGKEVLNLFRRYSAEGRKYGLFLIIISQRPSKLNQDILSECDNVCIMKIVSSDDIELLAKRFGYIEKETLKKNKVFTPGKAVFAGKWADDDTVTVEKVAPQRSKAGGINLKKKLFKKKAK